MNAHLDTNVEVLPPTRRAGDSVALPTETQQRVERIRTYHGGTLRAFRDQMGYAFLAGVELLALKESVKGEKGAFGEVRQQFLADIPERTQTQYMRFAEALQTKSATVADLAEQPLLITTGEIEEGNSKKLLKAVHDFADGATLTQMYRDLGVIREAKKEKHTPAKPASAKEKAEAEKAQAREWLGNFRGKVRLLLSHEKLSTRFSKDEIEEIRGLCLTARQFLAGELKDKELTKAIAAISTDSDSSNP